MRGKFAAPGDFAKPKRDILQFLIGGGQEDNGFLE
jgi:hypothetical protein